MIIDYELDHLICLHLLYLLIYLDKKPRYLPLLFLLVPALHVPLSLFSSFLSVCSSDLIIPFSFSSFSLEVIYFFDSIMLQHAFWRGPHAFWVYRWLMVIYILSNSR